MRQVTYSDAQGSNVKIVCDYIPDNAAVHLEDGKWSSGQIGISRRDFELCAKGDGRTRRASRGEEHMPDFKTIEASVWATEVRFSSQGRVAVLSLDDFADLREKMKEYQAYCDELLG